MGWCCIYPTGDKYLFFNSALEGASFLCIDIFFFSMQGKNNEGMQHLERIANLKEPVDDKSKAHYYEGLLILSR